MTVNDHPSSDIPIKGKRSKRRRLDTLKDLEEYIAICLVDLRGADEGSVSPTCSLKNSPDNNTEESPIAAAAAADDTSAPSTSSPVAAPNSDSCNNEDQSAVPSPQSNCHPAGKHHECSICNKVFLTHQALGGHKASHRAKPTAVILPTEPAAKIRVPLKPGDRVHQCGVCSKCFPSGQALGGHMRRHQPLNNGPRTDGTARDSINRGVSILFDDGGIFRANTQNFDLNLPPPLYPESAEDLLELDLSLDPPGTYKKRKIS